MTITTDTTLLHDPRRQAAPLYWQGIFRAADCRHVAMKRSDGAELETARRLGQSCPIAVCRNEPRSC